MTTTPQLLTRRRQQARPGAALVALHIGAMLAGAWYATGAVMDLARGLARLAAAF